jgi:choline dehydrogenase
MRHFMILPVSAFFSVCSLLFSAHYSSAVSPPLPSYASHRTFDHAVVGGGLIGINVASRLTENPSTTGLVIEVAGDNQRNDRDQDIRFLAALTFLMPTIHSGNTLRGGSSNNGAAWTHRLASQHDFWNHLLETREASLNWN